MFRTFKGKLSAVYLCLVLLIAIVGGMSVFSLFKLSKALDSLMVDNYKSINAVNSMLDALEKQDSAILLYINGDKQAGIDVFTENSSKFMEWNNVIRNNITENGEKETVKSINSSYISFTRLFSELQEAAKENKDSKSINFYNEKITPEFTKIKALLKKVTDLNEHAMFRSKNLATEDSIKDLYLLLFITVIAVSGGFVLSRYFINRFLKPMHALIQTIKLVREGDLNQETAVISNDEVGEMAVEFNNMTRRLLDYDRSSIGKLMVEKNKSLAIVKSIFDLLIVMDISYKILLINSAFEKFFGIREENALNKHFLEVIRNGELFDYISSAFESKEEYSEKIICINSNNNEFYFNVIVTGVRDIDHRLTGLVVSFHNVTQLKQLEMVKTDFLSTISHELKTPLTSVIMGTSLLENGNIGNLNEKQKNIVDAIKEDSDRLSNLVNNLLELSRIESGKAIFNIKPHTIINIINDSIRTLQEQINSKGIILETSFDEQLPSIRVDGEKITWVMNNLLSNALKYTASGDIIRISAKEQSGSIIVSIKDTGIGIPPEYQKKIFDKFVQVKGQDLEVRGTGLGLAIVKEIVNIHGGEIWCESIPEIGSTFSFTLPLPEGEA